MIYRKDKIEIHFESALLIAIAPAVITSLIDGMGEWSNSRNYKKTKALEAIQSFRNYVDSKIGILGVDYSKGMDNLSNIQMLRLVLFFNQWSVYMIDGIASKRVIKQALGNQLLMYLLSIEPSAGRIRYYYNIDGYYKLLTLING